MKESWYATDNGFSSVKAMDSSHQPIVDCAIKALGNDGGNVIDFGCGNGALLAKIYALNPHIVPFGIEIDLERARHIEKVLPQFKSNFQTGDMFENMDIWTRKYSLAILMPGRLLEAKRAQVASFREFLKKQCSKIIVYAYGDWLEKHGGLKELSEQVGLILLENHNPTVAIVEKII